MVWLSRNGELVTPKITLASLFQTTLGESEKNIVEPKKEWVVTIVFVNTDLEKCFFNVRS